MEGHQTKLRAARAFNLLLNDGEGHTLKVIKDRQLLFMLKLHNNKNNNRHIYEKTNMNMYKFCFFSILSTSSKIRINIIFIANYCKRNWLCVVDSKSWSRLMFKPSRLTNVKCRRCEMSFVFFCRYKLWL